MSKRRRLKNIPKGDLVSIGNNVYTVVEQQRAHTLLKHQGVIGRFNSGTGEIRTEGNQLMALHMCHNIK